MTTTKTKFSVGDKVRILDASGITLARTCGYSDGDTAVLELTQYGELGIPDKKHGGVPLPLHNSELAYIEKVDAKPTKNQRISALESQVAELQAQVARLQGVERVIKNVELAEHKPQPTPNELRKAIIAEARAFVAEQYRDDDVIETRGHVHPKVLTRAHFVVSDTKRTVTVVLKGIHTGRIYAKGIAKCAPGDVFNADIGKAIALGRALGLDVSKFEQAVQPTEVVAGMSVTNVPNDDYEVLGSYVVGYVDDGNAYDDDTSDGEGWIPVELLQILDDTEAQYE